MKFQNPAPATRPPVDAAREESTARLWPGRVKLIRLLRIRTQPIAIAVFEDANDMEKIQGLRRPPTASRSHPCLQRGTAISRW